MPPRRKRPKSPETASSRPTTAAPAPDPAQKKSKQSAPLTPDAILVAVKLSIGLSSVSGVPIPQLLELIAAYAQPFVMSQSVVTLAAGIDFDPVCWFDTEYLVVYSRWTKQLHRMSIRTGNTFDCSERLWSPGLIDR